MNEQRPWHRLFGMSLTDLFAGQPVRVEMEVDLSRKQQLLDVVVVRTSGEPITCQLPDGFEPLAAHNLISFKSYQEALDRWSMLELVGHYVNYRKQASPSVDDLLPEADFRVFAVCVRYPQTLAGQANFQRLGDGVYEAHAFGWPLRIIVAHQLPREEHNALLHLFAAQEDRVVYGGQHYRLRSPQTSTFLFELFARYKLEGVPVPFTKEQFVREALQKMAKDPDVIKWLQENTTPEERLKNVPVEKRLEGVPVEKRLEGVPVEKRLEGVPVEKRLEGVPPEKLLEGVPVEKRLQGLSAEDLLRHLPPETLETLRRSKSEDKTPPG